MMYPFMTLPDDTEIVHSEMVDGKVKVYIETPYEKDCFHHATCYLPDEKWTDVFGYDKEQMKNLKDIVKSEKHLIMEFAQNGGLLNAANF